MQYIVFCNIFKKKELNGKTWFFGSKSHVYNKDIKLAHYTVLRNVLFGMIKHLPHTLTVRNDKVITM